MAHCDRRAFLAAAAAGTAALTSHMRASEQSSALFRGFTTQKITTSGATIHTLHGRSGPPLLLIHGYPQTHVEWHKIAARLAQKFTVVMTDLRGYGDSSKPPDGENHVNYSKRAMALDQVELMRALGFERFAVVGHDRGARVAWRMAVEHPQAVTKLVVIDIVPLPYSRVTRAFATEYFHWFFLIQPAPFPETLIGNSAEFFLRSDFFDRTPRVTYSRRRHSANICAASKTRRQSMQRARTIAPEPRLISSTPIKMAARKSRARCWCCGVNEARSAASNR